MPSLAEMLGYLVQPLGGPMLPMLPKAASNATGGSIPGVVGPKGPPLSSPAELMNALTAIGNAQYENKLREAQAEQARATAGLLKTAVELGGTGPTYTTGGAAATPAAPAAWGSLGAPDVSASGGVSTGGGAFRDPRGVEPLIREAAVRYGHDPDTAVKVAQSEGLGTFLGDGGKSGSAFQLYTGGGLGNEFQKETGLSPLDPKNEPAAIDWAMRNLDRTGWSPYHGAKKVGVGSRDGISVGSPGSLPAVPNFGGMMVGNQGPSYAPAGAPVARPDAVVGSVPLTGPIPGYPTVRSAADRDYIAANPVSGAPMSLAPGLPTSMPAVPQGLASGMPRLDDASLARARRMENIYGILGKKMPTWAEEGVKMAPGGSMSPEYKGTIAATEAWAKVAPELFTQTQLKQVQGGIDLSLKEKQSMLDRANDEQKQRLADELKNRSEGRLFDPVTGAAVPVPGFNDVAAGTRGAVTGAEEAAKLPIQNARDLFQAQLARASKQLEQTGAASLDLVPITVDTPGGGREEIQGTREQAARLARGEAVPELGIAGRNVAPAAPGAVVPGAAGELAPGGVLAPPGRRVVGKAVGPAEQLRQAQTTARVAIDTKAAEEIGTQATMGRRLLPLLDEVTRLADKTPEGWAGPVAASIARSAAGIGFPVSERMSNAELMQSISQRLIPIVREPGPTSERELNIYLRAVPGLMQSADGRKKVAEVTRALVQRTIDISTVYRDNVGALDLTEKLAKLDKPLLTNDQRRAMGDDVPPDGKQIGTYKGKPVYLMPDGSRKVLQ
jgi:hypothetical protein